MARSTGRDKKRPTQKAIKEPERKRYLNGPGPLGIGALGNRISKGHDANRLSGSTITRLEAQANAVMVNQLNESVRFWIDEIQADFGLAGSYAQSHTRRQFFPHNIVQPSIKVTATFPNQASYNLFASFTHSSHHYSLRSQQLRDQGTAARTRPNDPATLIPTVKFYFKGGNKNFAGSKTSKGSHRPWLLEGYIKTIPAGAERFDYAPVMQFEFTIAESATTKNIGIWNDEAVQGSRIRPWMDIFNQHSLNDFVKPERRGKGKGKGKKGPRGPQGLPGRQGPTSTDLIGDVLDAINPFG